MRLRLRLRERKKERKKETERERERERQRERERARVCMRVCNLQDLGGSSTVVGVLDRRQKPPQEFIEEKLQRGICVCVCVQDPTQYLVKETERGGWAPERQRRRDDKNSKIAFWRVECLKRAPRLCLLGTFGVLRVSKVPRRNAKCQK